MKRSFSICAATALLILCAGVAPLLAADGARSEPVMSSTPSTPIPEPAPLQRPVQVESNAGPGFGSYSYDAAGNITTFGTHTFHYDVYGRLKKATLGGSASAEYTYDRYGNILTIVTDGQTGATLKLGVNAATNKLTVTQSPTGEAYTYAEYDAAGNVVRTPNLGDTYVYDGTNVMTESTVAGTNRLYLYTASGERLAAITMSNGVKQRADWTVRDPSGKVLRRFTELASSGWKWEEDYIYRDGQLLAAEIPGPDKTLHFHLDHLGTPRLITGNGGAQIAEHTYYPFGPELTSAGQDAELLKFTGHERDASSLDYMHARYYSPGWGRFLSVDPKLGDPRVPQSWNRYAYVMNNPLKYVDPTGENAVVVCDQQNNCTATVQAQIVADPNNPTQMNAARDFQQGAQQYWNNQNVTGPNGENITFNVNIAIVAPGQQQSGMDTLQVVSGSGRSQVNMTLFAGGSPPDTGTIYTQDNTNNPSGMQGIAAHETGHLLGLRDLYASGEVVPHNPSSNVDIMRYAQPTNSPRTGFMVLSPANTNSVVYRFPPVCLWGIC